MKKLLIGLVFLMGNGLILGWTQKECLSCFNNNSNGYYVYNGDDTIKITDLCDAAINFNNCTDCNCAKQAAITD